MEGREPRLELYLKVDPDTLAVYTMCVAEGIVLKVNSSRTRILTKPPPDELKEDHRECIRAYKPQLIKYLMYQRAREYLKKEAIKLGPQRATEAALHAFARGTREVLDGAFVTAGPREFTGALQVTVAEALGEGNLTKERHMRKQRGLERESHTPVVAMPDAERAEDKELNLFEERGA